MNEIVTLRELDVVIFQLLKPDREIVWHLCALDETDNQWVECESMGCSAEDESYAKQPCYKALRSLHDGSDLWFVVPQYSTDLAKAFRLVDYAKEAAEPKAVVHILSEAAKQGVVSEFHTATGLAFRASASTRPSTICLAFCKLMGRPVILER